MPPKAAARTSGANPRLSTSPASAASPPRFASSSSLASLPQIEVKPQKACVLCRRSKVKCIHDGAPPCKRCKDTKQESQCKFRLRADDETWRERTDEVLSKLGESVEWLVQQQQQQQGQGQQGYVKRADAIPSSSSPQSAASPRKSHSNANAPYRPSSRPSSTTYLGFDGAAGLLSPGDSHVKTNTSPHRPYRSPTSASQSYRQLHDPQILPPPLPPTSLHHGSSLYNTAPSAIPNTSAAPHLASSYHNLSGRPAPSYQSRSAPSIEPGQSRPSSIIYFAQQPCSNIGEPSKASASAPRPKSASPYAHPSHCIGRNDPRLTVISMGLVSMEQARHLFKFFARYLQPHCFGFPTYLANEHMTPLIIACILMVSSMHEPNSRHIFEWLRHEAFSSPLLLDQPIDRSAPLDPELGIGVEEITGACIAACWLGGQTALSIAQLARYWAIGYLEHFEVRSAQTLGEWMTILPPFRQIDLVGKLRIWLMSYITEAQQAVINDKPSLFPESQPAHYCQGLLNASSHSADFGESLADRDGVRRFSEGASKTDGTPNSAYSGNDGAGGIGSFASDRQLVAHARMMSILLAAQDLHRSARAAIASSKPTPPGQQHAASRPTASRPQRESILLEASHSIERWREWLDELNHWRLLTSQHSDLSDSSPETIDLSLLYHLSRTFLASHPLDPELGILDETQHALKAASSANPPDFSRLAIAQLRTISTAKHSALFALKLATTEFGEKLSYLPQFYHWLLGHAAGLLMLLVQRRETFLMAKEAEALLEVTEKFVQLYVFRITSHSFHSAASEYGGATGAQRMKRSASQAELGEPDRRRQNGAGAAADVDGNGLDQHGDTGAATDPLSFQWPFMSGFPTKAEATPGPAANPVAQQQLLAHGNPADKHPALANAQALARTLYLVKMQIQSLDVQL